MLTSADITALLTELGTRLEAKGLSGRIVLAGGAAIALRYGIRASTKDIDAVSIEPEALRIEAESLGSERGLPTGWVNEQVARFALGRSPGPVLLTVPGLVVHMVPPAQLLAMKRSAMRDDIDYADARAVLAEFTGSREDVWGQVEPFLLPGMVEWKRQNFDALWKESHASE